MTKNKIPTDHLDINNSTIYVCDVVRFSNEIFVVKYDKFFYPVNPNFNNGEYVFARPFSKSCNPSFPAPETA